MSKTSTCCQWGMCSTSGGCTSSEQSSTQKQCETFIRYPSTIGHGLLDDQDLAPYDDTYIQSPAQSHQTAYGIPQAHVDYLNDIVDLASKNKFHDARDLLQVGHGIVDPYYLDRAAKYLHSRIGLTHV